MLSIAVNQVQKDILNLIQEDFPLTSRPFLFIANKLGLTELEVIDILKELKDEGYIRRIGGFFDTKSLGYISTLCAMKVEDSRIEEIANIINSYTGVTHNYIRNHEMNMWFTLSAESREHLNEILEEIKNRTNISDILILNSTKTHKVKVHLCL